MQPAQTLKWLLDAGVDEVIDHHPVNHTLRPVAVPVREALPIAQIFETHTPPILPTPDSRLPTPQATRHSPLTTSLEHSPSAAMAKARALADAAMSVSELEAAIKNFDGCAIKKTATQTVFADGNREADILFIGEAPGAQEDLQGIPFCGPSGQLLDKMMASIGLSRGNVLISNTVFWRPPGNRQPSKEETAICRPFVEKLVALMSPKLLVLVGGTACTAVLQQEVGITRLRGKMHNYTSPYLAHSIPTAVIFHPSYLLRQPSHKRLAWQDLLQIKALLDN